MEAERVDDEDVAEAAHADDEDVAEAAPGGEPVSGVDGERGLADPGQAGQGRDHDGRRALEILGGRTLGMFLAALDQTIGQLDEAVSRRNRPASTPVRGRAAP